MLQTLSDEDIRSEWRMLACSGQIPVKLKVSRCPNGSFYLPDPKGTEEIEMVFRAMNFEDYATIDDLVSIEYEVDAIQRVVIRETDFAGMRWWMMRRLPLAWNLGIPLTYENGWLTGEGWERIKRLPAPLVDALLDKYEPYVSVDSLEERVIDRQSTALFGEHSRGVMNACKAISLYCLLVGFWEKFGLNRFDLVKLPYVEYLRLRRMIGNDNEATRRRMKARDSSPRAKVIGAGGRPSARRSVVIGQ